MSDTVVDARGMICPKPLILTKKALLGLETGQSMKVLIDNDISRQNVERFLKDNGAHTIVTVSEGVYTLKVTKVRDAMPAPDAAAYCTPSQHPAHVIAIRSNTMGSGPEDLGGILIKAFINTIKEVTPLPSHIVFYNSGILLAVNDSPLAEPIRDLQARGVKILICGTCADYFQKKENISTGTISNMYTILEILSAAHHVITP